MTVLPIKLLLKQLTRRTINNTLMIMAIIYILITYYILSNIFLVRFTRLYNRLYKKRHFIEHVKRANANACKLPRKHSDVSGINFYLHTVCEMGAMNFLIEHALRGCRSFYTYRVAELSVRLLTGLLDGEWTIRRLERWHSIPA